ncbi:PadR family transcriptional regulator [Lactobacillus sp. CC-MHH1034]|uniref:PadR family transcriptional regulator n=1 Tax=Agrilactobacillus fermenti TaxID=2586909 RepID=UPI001E2E418F|nr:PadR family transcriptional regulator [Agrilactobacillus fermenti]MCD2256924.1 PadR family transcriptional regulator [Agrilactobacillus fermenti]
MNTQLLKGVLEGCILLVIQQEPIYGYALIQKLRQFGFESLVGGTVYPILQKLEKNGQIQGEMRKSPEGPDRKYFEITEVGKGTIQQFIAEWQQLTTNVTKIIKVANDHGDTQ